jgi:aarF domain-containing kinase
MSGRRLLDLAKFVNASRNIAKQHLELRSKQLDAYSKTSTLAKAAKSQTDRVTLTVQAAAALAKRLNEEVPKYAENFSPQNESGDRHVRVPRNSGERTAKAKGLREDRQYEGAGRRSQQEQVPEGGLEVRQEKAAREPLPDGTIPPKDAPIGQASAGEDTYTKIPKSEPVKRPLEEQQEDVSEIRPVESDSSTIPIPKVTSYSAEDARELQRKAESQIPYVTAAASTLKAEDHDRDVYHERSTGENTAYSSLPRAKIPKHTRDGQKESLDGRLINSDVFHKRPEPSGSTSAGFQDAPEGVDVNVFRSSKVSDTLGVRKPGGAQTSRARPRGSQSEVANAIHPALRDSRDSSHVPVMDAEVMEQGSMAWHSKDSEDEMRNFAEDMAEDAAKATASDVKVRESS